MLDIATIFAYFRSDDLSHSDELWDEDDDESDDTDILSRCRDKCSDTITDHNQWRQPHDTRKTRMDDKLPSGSSQDTSNRWDHTSDTEECPDIECTIAIFFKITTPDIDVGFLEISSIIHRTEFIAQLLTISIAKHITENDGYKHRDNQSNNASWESSYSVE